MHKSFFIGRRQFFRQAALGATLFAAPGAFAELLVETARQTEGPFYPDKLPLDTDNDLLIVNDTITPAVGEVTHLSGRIMDLRGNPVRNALVEIWQVDNQGIYVHTGSPERAKFDSHFQGFGRFLTGSSGEYYFRTIKPVLYGDTSFQRTPHIHFAVHIQGQPKYTTQCYIQGAPTNEQDSVLRGIQDEKARASVIVPFAPIADSKAGELAAAFDIIIGLTPATA
ncbi:MAG: intradiol ring-cleavage dioxygenase [Candidatus Hydrogenedentes bacterium]|nr:intradiol ring-cleavage dioxygenase [Candidatus Hydrogenedentota bacterium]